MRITEFNTETQTRWIIFCLLMQHYLRSNSDSHDLKSIQLKLAERRLEKVNLIFFI